MTYAIQFRFEFRGMRIKGPADRWQAGLEGNVVTNFE
jgi:hypothetical protein